jgi:hypothetical protein
MLGYARSRAKSFTMRKSDVNRIIERMQQEMPSRIQVLADQAKDSIPKDEYGVDDWIKEYNNRFAKLVIQDVVALVEVWEIDSRNHISYLIKHYYGVH